MNKKKIEIVVKDNEYYWKIRIIFILGVVIGFALGWNLHMISIWFS